MFTNCDGEQSFNLNRDVNLEMAVLIPPASWEAGNAKSDIPLSTGACLLCYMYSSCFYMILHTFIPNVGLALKETAKERHLGGSTSDCCTVSGDF